MSYQIFDMYGKQMSIAAINGSRVIIDLSGYASGLYIIQINQNNNILSQQKIIRK